MDANVLKDLLANRRLQKYEYDIYVLFELSDIGREFLKVMIDSVLLEEPMKLNRHDVMWHDGRRSVWRHIKLTIKRVQTLLEERSHE